MILAGDVGGTNTRLAAFEMEGSLVPIVAKTFPSQGHASLDEIVRAFVTTHGLAIGAACFGVAGPVSRGQAQVTNLPWKIDARSLATVLALPEVGLINDLEANAHGIGVLGPEDFAVLHPGADNATGNQAVIAAGTGLGEAGLYWDGKHYRPFASEGGHTDFAPTDALQVELLCYLQERFGHVSWERVLSGPGLFNLYLFLRDTGRGCEPEWLATELQVHADPAMVISRAAVAGRCPLCSAALELLVALYGSEAGNLALKTMATGGVFLGGGIAPRILDRLRERVFIETFVAKGRMRPLLEAIPVRVILNDRAALLGAARYAQTTAL